MKEKKTGRAIGAAAIAAIVLMVSIIIILGGVSLFSRKTTDTDSKKQPKNVNGIVTDDMKVQFSYGYENYIKYGRDIQLSFQVENTGDNMNGKIQVEVPVEYSESIIYEKEMEIAAGEEKNIKMYIPTNLADNKLNMTIKDDKGSVMGEFSARLNFRGNQGQSFIGIVTEEEAGVGYMASSDSQICYVSPDELADDVRGLDTLDIIVLDQIASGSLSDAQLRALTLWVEDGGSLVIGTGANASQSLEAFSGTLLSGTIGETEPCETMFGYQVLDEESYLQECFIRKREEKAEAAREFVEDNMDAVDSDYTSYVQNYQLPVVLYHSLDKKSDEEYFLGWDGKEDTDDGMLYDLIQGLKQFYSIEEIKENLNVSLSAKEKKKLEKEAAKNWEVKPLTIQHVNLQLENSSVLLEDGGRTLMQKVDYGKGNVIVAQFGLNIANRVWTSIGASLRDIIINHISDAKKKQLEQEAEDGYYSEFMDALDMDDSDSLPNVSVYIVILGIYVLLIGPVLYLICKIKDKRHLLWGIIPVCSVLFSLFIYFIGSSTRISDTFVNYITCMELGKNGRMDETSYIRVVSPSNKGYELDVKGDAVVSYYTWFHYYDSFYGTDEEYSSYITMEEQQDGTKVSVRNKPAFSSTTLQIESTRTYEKGIDTDICYADFQMTGTITNNLDYDLEQVVLVLDGAAYSIGDMKKGEVFDVSTLTDRDLTSSAYVYGVSGIDPYDYSYSSETRAKASALNTYYYNGKHDQYVMGIAKDISAQGSVSDLGYDAFGVNMFVQPFEISATIDGTDMIMDIRNGSDWNVMSGNVEERWMYSEMVEISYIFHENMEMDKLYYNALNNEEFNSSRGGYAKSGTISLFNQITGDYEVVFSSGLEGEIDLSQYIGSNNSIRILYQVPQADIDDSEVLLPVLAATYKEKEETTLNESAKTDASVAMGKGK